MKSELEQIPGVGPNLADHLKAVGVRRIADLAGRSPEELYALDCAAQGVQVDRCVLYVYRLAVAFAEGQIKDPEQLKWWNWKD